MKIRGLIILIALLLVLSSCWNPDFKNAHPNAQKLMTDEFLWNSLEPTAPFGNDDGADAIWEFYNWRKTNKKQKAINFIDYLLKEEWKYDVYNYSITDTVEIGEFIETSSIGDRLFFGIDDIIIATCFGQFIIEGKIDSDLKQLTLIALERQKLQFSLKHINENYRESRKKQLERMIEIINAA